METPAYEIHRMRDDEAEQVQGSTSYTLAEQPKVDVDAVANRQEQKIVIQQPAVTTVIPTAPAPAMAVKAKAPGIFLRMWRYLFGGGEVTNKPKVHKDTRNQHRDHHRDKRDRDHRGGRHGLHGRDKHDRNDRTRNRGISSGSEHRGGANDEMQPRRDQPKQRRGSQEPRRDRNQEAPRAQPQVAASNEAAPTTEGAQQHQDQTRHERGGRGRRNRRRRGGRGRGGEDRMNRDPSSASNNSTNESGLASSASGDFNTSQNVSNDAQDHSHSYDAPGNPPRESHSPVVEHHHSSSTQDSSPAWSGSDSTPTHHE